MEEGGVEGAVAGEDDFVSQGALASHDEGVVVGVDVGGVAVLGVGFGGGDGVVVAIAAEVDFDPLVAVVEDGLLFDAWGGARHVDAGVDVELFGGEGDALGVVAGGGGDDAVVGLFWGEGGHDVAGAAPFVGFYGGEVFTFDPNLWAGLIAWESEAFEWGGLAEAVDALASEEDFLS